jgi:hypothetical protein
MRIDPKYFNKFIFVIAVICVIAIIYFNFFYQQRQLIQIDERIGDGSVLVESRFALLDGSGETAIAGLPADLKVILFWATWSERSAELAGIISNALSQRSDQTVLISAVVRDSSALPESLELTGKDGVWHVNGTPQYNDLQIPGIPAVFVFDRDNRLTHYRIGYRTSRDYDELLQILAQ